MRIRALACLIVALVATTAWAKVDVDYDTMVDFSKYETFSWGGGTPAPNPLAQKRLVVAVEEQLVAKGLSKVESGADLIVEMHARSDAETRIDVDDLGYGYRRRFWGATTVNVREVTVGMVMVDLVDTESKQLVWRAVASDTLSTTPEKNEKKIKRAAKKMFKRFPPKKK